MAIALRHAPGRRRLAPYRQADQYRTPYRPRCTRWWQVGWKSNRPSCVAMAWWVATVRLDNVVPPYSSPVSTPALPAQRRNRYEYSWSADRTQPTRHMSAWWRIHQTARL